MVDAVAGSKILSDKPIIAYLYEDEQPHFILRFQEIKTTDDRIPTQDSSSLFSTSSAMHRGYAVITDKRIAMLVEDGDDIVEKSIKFNELVEATLSRNLKDIVLSHHPRLLLDTGDYEYTFNFMYTTWPKETKEKSEKEIRRAVQYIKQQAYSTD